MHYLINRFVVRNAGAIGVPLPIRALSSAVQILELADECIRQDVESVLDCEIVRDNDDADA